MNYDTFLASKSRVAAQSGIPRGEIPNLCPALKSFQRVCVNWSLERARTALFLDTGLGKTISQVSWASAVLEFVNCSNPDDHGAVALIFAPLAVAQQTIREMAGFGFDVNYATDQANLKPGLNITNYERLDGSTLEDVSAVVLDESSILKSYQGKTKRQLIELCSSVPYRLCCTATPAPNDHVELGNHAEFLGVMKSEDMLARWFTNSTTNAGEWKLKAHGATEFWAWVASWAICINKPSDLPNPDGHEPFSDEGYDLPPLELAQHVVTVDQTTDAGNALFRGVSMNAANMHREMRLTAQARAAEVARLVRLEPDETWAIWCNTDYEADALLEAIPTAVEVRGSELAHIKMRKLEQFSTGEIKILVTKPAIAGWGLNWQHCARTAFVGLSFSFELFYQALRRFYRFGQARGVFAHVVCAETELGVFDTVMDKAADHRRFQREMVDAMRVPSGEAFKKQMGLAHSRTARGQDFTLFNGDCVDVVADLPSDSVHLSMFSPPFSSLYTYSPLWRDMGNSSSHEEFFEHFKFLLRELLRVTVPGRLAALHVKNLVRYKSKTGQAGIYDFRGDVIRAMESIQNDDSRWVYHSEICIWTDPVREMQRTKAQGLLYKQLRSDSSFTRMGMPEYVIVFRKWHDEYLTPEPVTHTHESFPLSQWQEYASPVWFDIDRTDVLNAKLARISEDEKHLAPLQLEIVRRCLRLWSNPGDTILSPFAGIGSEGVVSLEQGRKFIGVELNDRYWAHAKRHLEEAEAMAAQSLFPEVA
jgi:DNA modification methylase